MNLDSLSSWSGIRSLDAPVEAASTTETKRRPGLALLRPQTKVLRAEHLSHPLCIETVFTHIATFLETDSCKGQLEVLSGIERARHDPMSELGEIKVLESSTTTGLIESAISANTQALVQSLNRKLKFDKIDELTKDLEEAIELSKKEEIPVIYALYKSAPYLCELLLHLDPSPSGRNSHLVSALENFSMEKWTDQPLPRGLPEALVYASDNPKIASILEQYVESAGECKLEGYSLHAVASAYDKYKKPVALAALTKLGFSKDLKVRSLVTQALARSKSAEALQALSAIERNTAENFDETEAEIIREAVVKAYIEINTYEAFAAIKVLRDKKMITGRAFIFACSQFTLPEAFTPLRKFKDSTYNEIREAVVKGCRKSRPDDSFAVFEALLFDDCEYVRAEVAEALGELGTLEAYQALSSMKIDLHETVATNSTIKALGKYNREEVLDTLLDLLRIDRDGSYTENIVRVCSHFTSASAIEAIRALSYSTDRNVRYTVASSCGNLEPSVAFEIIDRLQYDLDPYVRMGVAEACGNFTDSETVHAVTKFLDKLHTDPNNDVKVSVGKSCTKLQTETAFDIVWKLRKDLPKTEDLGSYLR